MKPESFALGGTFTVVVRTLLGAVFLYSSAGKIADPAAFAAVITNYQLLSPQWVPLTAVIFPWVEAVCGLALISGRCENGAALLVSLMMVFFIGIMLFNGYRGLNVACGCFSLSAKEPSSLVGNILRNLLFLAAGAWVMVFSKRRRPTTAP